MQRCLVIYAVPVLVLLILLGFGILAATEVLSFTWGQPRFVLPAKLLTLPVCVGAACIIAFIALRGRK